jgi:hypothetical protein
LVHGGDIHVRGSSKGRKEREGKGKKGKERFLKKTVLGLSPWMMEFWG